MRSRLILPFFLTTVINLSHAILVTNGDDDGDGSLRQAIERANNTGENIEFNGSLTISLSGDPLVISNTYTIDGGENAITVSGGNAVLPFFVASGNAVIRNITIDSGKAKGGNGGASISAGAGGGGAGLGGGAFVDGSPTFENVIFSNCNAEGGAGGITGSGSATTAGGGGGGLGGNGGGSTTADSIGGNGGGGVFFSYPGATNGNVVDGALGGKGIDGSRVGGDGGEGSTDDAGKDGMDGLRFGGGGGGGESRAIRTRGGSGGFGGGGAGEGDANASSPTTDRGGGAGGFGGGGGGTADQSSASPGPGGFGGGSGGVGNPSEPEKSGGFGGGGAGCGGALFVSESSSTTLSYTSSVAATAPFSGNSVTAGAGPEATDGEAVGPNIFLRGGGVLKFDIDGPVTLKLPSMIKTDPSEPFSTITKLGGGTLIMDPVSQDSDVNDFKSLINLNQGTIVIDDDNQLGNEDSELIFNGGILKNSSSSFGINRLTDLEGNGTFEVENGTTLNQNGDISGSGALTKTGAGTLILSGTNTYTGGTVISDGILSVSSSDRLGSGDLTFNGGSLKITSPLFSYSRNMNLAGTGTFDVAELSLVELSGVLSGAGGLTKEGSGDLILSGVNTYSGRTIINGGGLSLSGTLGAAKDLLINGGSFVIPEGAGEKTVNVLNGSGTIDNLGDNVLDLGSGDYSGTIRGTGTLKKVGAGTLRLSGDNTFTGDLILDGGTLSFSSDNNLGTGTLRLNGGTLSPSGSTTTEKEIDIGVASQIDVADGIDLTLSGTLTGQGNLEKTGPGKMILTGSSPVPERITTVQQGILSVNGTVEGPVNISPAATLMGTGTVGSVGNDGTVSPGNSIGTLSINGDYTQGSSAFLTVEIDDDPADSDLMIVSGTADLDGSLIVVPLPGIYEAGTTYTFLQADAVTGQFKQLLRNHPLDFVINYLADAVQIQIAFNGYTLPEDIDSLSGNTKKIATYLFSDSTFIENDLISILKPLVRLSPREFSDGLLQLGPEQFGALALSNLRMSVSTGQAMNRAAAIYDDYFSNDYRSARKSGSDCDRSIWFNPIGYYYKQNKIDDRVPFNSRTYGFTTGYSALFSKHLVVSAGLGYSRSNLHWYRDNGNAVIQSFSLSPSVGYLGKQGYVGIMVAGGRSFYDVDRKIHFSNIKRTAHNDHKSYDVLAGFTGALNLKFPDKFQTNLFLLPIVNLDYLNIFESGYRESGAGVIDLAVKKVRSSFLRPEIKVKLLKQLMTDTLRAFPNIYAGWLKNIPLTDGNYTSKLYKQQTVDGNFTVRGYDSSTDEAVLGAELLVNHKEHCSIKIGYEINIGHRYRVQEVGINIHRRF